MNKKIQVIFLLLTLVILVPVKEVFCAGTRSEFSDILLNENSIILLFDNVPRYELEEYSEKIILSMANCLNKYEYKSINVNNGYVGKVSVSHSEQKPEPTVQITFAMTAPYGYAITEKDDILQLAFRDKFAVVEDEDDAEDEMDAKVFAKEPVKSKGPKTKKRKKKVMPSVKKYVPLVDRMTREPVSMDFNQADVRDVLRLLSAKSGINMIYGEDVSGSLTIHLEDVPFREAFDTILSIKGFVVQQVGENILRILEPRTLIEERAKAATFTKVLPLNYAVACEVKRNLDAVRAAEGRKGAIEIDGRTNSLIVTDTPEGLVSIEKLILELDSKPKQVLIEAKLVEVSSDDMLSLGISWRGNQGRQRFDPATGNYLGDEILIGGGGDDNILGSRVYDPTSGLWGYTGDVTSPGSGGTGISLPGPAASAGVAIGYINNDMSLYAQLSALATKGKAKVLSNPKITTINNKLAKIEVIDQVPYLQSSVDDGVTTVETVFVDVGITLEVTPTINANNMITLVIKPEVSNATLSASGQPTIAIRRTDTTVLIRNGETLVIGGLIKEQDEEGIEKVPFFGDLPILGYLFKKETNAKRRTELLVFITPRILVE